jgi:hypothetical protein
MVTREEAKKALDDLLYSAQMNAYFKGYKTGYKAGSQNKNYRAGYEDGLEEGAKQYTLGFQEAKEVYGLSDLKKDPKRSILTEEEENGAAKMGEMKFNAEQICYRIQYLRKKEIVWAIRSILEGGEEGKTQLGGKSK